MFHEIQVTGVEFEEYWDKCVEDGVAYFFSWLGKPRATVLVVLSCEEPTHIECRKIGDLLVTEEELEPVYAEVIKLFQDAGFWRNELSH